MKIEQLKCMHSSELLWTVNLLIDESVNVLLTTQAMLYHVRVAETTAITGNSSHSQDKINTFLYDFMFGAMSSFFLWVKSGSIYKRGKHVYFFLRRFSRYRF